MKNWIKLAGREKRHKILRQKVSGTGEKPRLSIYRSLNNLYAQLIDDTTGRTLVSLATNSPSLKEAVKKSGGNVKGAAALGTAIAEICKKNCISNVVFDRSGYLYHGRVKALADAARKGGLQF